MASITFITGNQDKADYLAKYIGMPIKHVKIELDEIQSMDLKEIVEHKVKQAFQKINSPVLVEDVSLEFEALGGLPGPFIKFFVEKMNFEDICSLLNNKNRNAVAKCVFGYFDGKTLKTFDGQMKGLISEYPKGEKGFGWDKIFIPEGYTITRAEMDEQDDQKTYLQIKPLEKVKEFLLELK